MAEQNYEIPDEFLDAADRFVSLANEMGEEAVARLGARGLHVRGRPLQRLHLDHP